jgi:lipopolysaccharide transport system ATP-binding protein
MAHIEFKHVHVDIPIYNAKSRSMRNRLVQIATGGQLDADANGCVVVRALDNINFTFQDGDRIGLIGHNGAGKSTLLRVLSGVYAPTSGSVNIHGSIGSLIDLSLGIDPEFTGRENVYFRGRLLGISKAEITQKIDDIIEFSELGNFFDMPLRTYSSGMHLRLAFAVSTMLHPEILLMDEWLSVGDKNFMHKAQQRLKEVVDATNILVIASHSRDLILRTCNRVIWLNHGKIHMDDKPDAVVDAFFGPQS